ncbi:hypothetical protein I2I05_21270 [Hymenobacter sp. BT683]|uniref:Lipoprotein n=1 Tax=Hymenobacter jeongseonensis TaxID=2791027 RepID=A0ABS0IP07_9BACT|nr:hypothetical protein [Hymenobacter jeongseonensis]MBF9239937.1 hypothetical protein [Hymenobacter jeongseonensis]
MNAIFLRQLVVAFAGLLLGCQPNTSTQPETAVAADAVAASVLTPGAWRGVLAVQGQEIPFLFKVKTEAGKPVVYLVNNGLEGQQQLRCDRISVAGDSVTIRLHGANAALIVRANGTNKLKGTWVKYGKKTSYRVPLNAEAGEQPLFTEDDFSAGKVLPTIHIAMVKGATYKTRFRDNDGNVYPAVGTIKAGKCTTPQKLDSLGGVC